MRQFSEIIKSWEDAAELGRYYRLAGDEARFDLGDLARFVCERRDGRPLPGAEAKTISAFAREIGEPRPVVSQLMAMAEFLPDDDDRQKCYERGAGWHTMNAARIRSGWKPGEAVTEKQAALFWAIIDKTMDDDAVEKIDPIQYELNWLQQEHDRLGRHGLQEGRPQAVYHALAEAQAALTEGISSLTSAKIII